MQYLKGQCLNDTTLGNKVTPDWLVSNSSILGWLESSLNYIAGSGYIIKKMKKKMLNRLEPPLLSPQTYTQCTVYSKDVWYRLPKPGAKSLKIKGSDPISQILLSPCQAGSVFWNENIGRLGISQLHCLWKVVRILSAMRKGAQIFPSLEFPFQRARASE